MHIVFLDNFRGFQKDLTILTPVTFLVGENSSGKSSFLSAVSLLNSFEFWADPSFRGDELNLGSFQDIVSRNSKNRSYFTMGWIENVAEDDSQQPMFALLTFVNRGGRPRLSKYSFLHHKSVVSVEYTTKMVRYKIEKIRHKKNGFNLAVDKAFEKLSKSHKSRLKDFVSVENDVAAYRVRSPYFGPMTFVKDFHKEVDGKRARTPVMMGSESITSIAPIRTTPRPIYDTVEADRDSLGSHTPYVLRRELSKKGKTNKLRSALRLFGKESGLFTDVKVHSFGKSGDSPISSGTPFEIGIVLDKQPINLPFVGYGVSQVLPVIVEAIVGGNDDIFIIQQPEVHLHPKAQAAFGDLLFRLSSIEDKFFFVETHSDYMVDRFRLAMSKVKKSSQRPLSSVAFFERREGFNESKFILIRETGEYSSNQPKGFREFFIKETIEMLGI